jgi:hypothetical protein
MLRIARRRDDDDNVHALLPAGLEQERDCQARPGHRRFAAAARKSRSASRTSGCDRFQTAKGGFIAGKSAGQCVSTRPS